MHMYSELAYFTRGGVHHSLHRLAVELYINLLSIYQI